MRLAFAILLDTETHNYVRKMQLAIAQRYNATRAIKISPHITLKAPMDVDALEPFEKYLDDLAAVSEPFEIELDGIGFFEPEVIFIDVKDNPRLHELHIKVITELKDQFGIALNEFEGENKKFHLTLASHDISLEDFYEARDWLKNEHPKFRFALTTLALFYYLSDEAGWIVYKKAQVRPFK